VSRNDASAPVLGAFGLVAAILQFMATVQLGLAPNDALAAASAESARYYLIGGLASLIGLVGVWTLRRRPLVAVGLLLGWQAAVYWPLRARTSQLGLAYYGEFILHHFVTFVAAAVILRVAWQFATHESLPRGRGVVAGLAVVGTLVALAAHLWVQPGIGERLELPRWSAIAPVALIAAWVSAIVVTWWKIETPLVRLAGPLLVLPWVVRLAVGGAGGPLGEPVPWTGRPWLMGSFVVAGVAAFVLLRPKMARTLWALVMLSSFVATAMLYLVYRRGFGDLEDGLGGLAASVFGFVPPYPQYVPAYQAIAVMLGLFGVFVATYASLIAHRSRPRGVALALLVVAGVGLTSPQLWLMIGAAGLLLVGSGLPSPRPDDTGPAAPALPVEPLLAAAATRLRLPAPVVLEGDDGPLVALRGEVDAQPVDLRARPVDDGQWSIDLVVGTPGRGKPEVELVPDDSDRGNRPAHLLARTHQVRGSRPLVEGLDDALLDTLVALPDCRVALWPTGARVQLGDDLRALTSRGLADLVDALRDRL
jgi:hypothetical protein